MTIVNGVPILNDFTPISTTLAITVGGVTMRGHSQTIGHGNPFSYILAVFTPGEGAGPNVHGWAY